MSSDVFSVDPAAGPQPLGECNICGSLELFQQRKQAICVSCRSDARTRLMWLLLTSRNLLRPGLRILHFAPERSIAGRLREILGDGYEPVDFDPAGFPDVPGVRKFDLVADAPALPTGAYDLIIHAHVMEHVRCNVTAILFHLHRALAPSGGQVCSIPMTRDAFYEEDLSPLAEAEATTRFGQNDHVRRFGAADIQLTLGMIFMQPRSTATASTSPCEPAGHRAA
jgi:phosphoglycolate phosphatase